MISQHCYAEDIGKEEVFEFRNRVKIRALESHDNPHRIIAEASGELTKRIRIKALYSNNAEFSLTVGMLPALAHLPLFLQTVKLSDPNFLLKQYQYT